MPTGAGSRVRKQAEVGLVVVAIDCPPWGSSRQASHPCQEDKPSMAVYPETNWLNRTRSARLPSQKQNETCHLLPPDQPDQTSSTTRAIPRRPESGEKIAPWRTSPTPAS